MPENIIGKMFINSFPKLNHLVPKVFCTIWTSSYLFFLLVNLQTSVELKVLIFNADNSKDMSVLIKPTNFN